MDVGLAGVVIAGIVSITVAVVKFVPVRNGGARNKREDERAANQEREHHQLMMDVAVLKRDHEAFTESIKAIFSQLTALRAVIYEDVQERKRIDRH